MMICLMKSALLEMTQVVAADPTARMMKTRTKAKTTTVLEPSQVEMTVPTTKETTTRTHQMITAMNQTTTGSARSSTFTYYTPTRKRGMH